MEKIVTEKEELINEEQYLKEERKGIRELEGKYEFHLGEKIFIGGAAKEHNAISTNLTVLIGSFIMDKAYQLYHSDMRTYAPATGSYFYPDLVLVKDEPAFKDDTFDNLLNPVLVIEILSKSTASLDRGEKFKTYRDIPSLQHYLAVSYTSQMIEHYQKLNDSEWKLKIIKDEEDKLELLEGLSLSMKDIYCNVKFAEKD
jgi:Uma2 family endonuclease